MTGGFPERFLRDFLAPQISDLRTMIVNARDCEERLSQLDQEFFGLSPDAGGPTSLDLMRRIVGRRNLRGLRHLHDLQLLMQPGKANSEFTLLEGGASADILALAPETGTFYLLELKKSVPAERQAVGELSAYSQGLHNRFWGITSSDVVWVPVSTEWSAPVRAAFAYQIISHDVAVLPLRATVEFAPGSSKIAGVQLELLDLIPEIDEPLAAAQFAWDCFDTLVFSLADEPTRASSVIDFITAAAARYRFSGFVTYGKSLLEGNLPFPYTFTIAVQNPFKSLLKRRQLAVVRDSGRPNSLLEMRREVKNNLWQHHDIDFRTGDDVWNNNQVDPNHSVVFGQVDTDYVESVSVAEIASAACNRTSELFQQLAERFKLLPSGYEVNTPHLWSLVKGGPLCFPRVESVGYFGLFQEALYERLMWEFHNRTEFGDGPVLGDLCGDPTGRAIHPNTLFEFLELMNWGHDSQGGYADEEDSDAIVDQEGLIVDNIIGKYPPDENSTGTTEGTGNPIS